MAASVAAIRRYGWVSIKQAGERDCRSTASDAIDIAVPPAKPTREQWADWVSQRPTDADRAEAADVIAWVKGLSPRSDYERNLVAVCSGEGVSLRHVGIAASAVTAFRRERERDVERRIVRATSQHLGQVGERAEFEFVCLGVRHIDGQYGTTSLVLLAAPDGSRAKWFASGLREFREGERLRGKATVKAHEVYEGCATTVLTRCKFSKSDFAA